ASACVRGRTVSEVKAWPADADRRAIGASGGSEVGGQTAGRAAGSCAVGTASFATGGASRSAPRRAGIVAGLRARRPEGLAANRGDGNLQPLHFAMGAAGGEALGAQRIDAGIDAGFLAMDIYRFDGADAQQRAA
ncbi:hypothetical protein, partial [Leclercia adecarboxylata]|uniref:hypothetical protein n=1 Tax=Leclercia adecarboxylata TaxID=83655 RepID=UPI00234D6296